MSSICIAINCLIIDRKTGRIRRLEQTYCDFDLIQRHLFLIIQEHEKIEISNEFLVYDQDIADMWIPTI